MAPRALLLALLPALLHCGEPLARVPAENASTTARAERAEGEAEAAPEPEPRFDPEVVRLAEGSPVRAVREALEAGRHSEAMVLLEESMPEVSAADRPLLLWLGASVARHNDRPLQARAYLAELGELEHPLALWARLRLAESLLEEEPPQDAQPLSTAQIEQAQALLTALAQEEWTGRRDARRLRALSLARQGRPEALPLLRGMLPRAEQEVAAEIALPLAELLLTSEAVQGEEGEEGEEGGDPRLAAQEEALALVRRVAYRQPDSADGRRAAEREAQILAALPEARREALAAPPVELAFARAQVLADAQRHRAAERALAELLPRVTDNATLRCHARLLQGKVIRNQREHRARAAAMLASIADDCEEEDVRAWARYYSGRSYTSAGQAPLALTQYERLEAEVPSHRLADDARLRAAQIHQEAGRGERAHELLSTLPERYPQGDMAGQARFMLAWQARAEGDHARALALLDASLEAGAQEEDEDIRGRTAYWRARTLQDLDRSEEAARAYLELGRRHPLSYYAQQAHARLLEIDTAQARALRRSWTRAPEAPPSGGAEDSAAGARLDFPILPEMERPAFARAVALLQVGDLRRARRELSAAGILVDGASADRLWLAAALYERAGEPARAVALARGELREFMDEAPTGRHRQLWRVAFPKAFAPVIEGAAEAESLPPALVFAIAREESSFRPRVVSWAQAYGLVQLIRPTARRFARPLGLPSDPASLQRPEVNVRIGARYMGWLSERYGGNLALIPPAYNAGSTALERWLGERGQLPLDAFVEEIPYDETRRYTRRVLQSYGIYRWLESGELPSLPQRLPAPPG